MLGGTEWKGEERNCFEGLGGGRKELIEKRGEGLAEVERLREEAGVRGEELLERERRMRREERWQRIRGFRFNKWYGMIKGEGISEYFKKGWGESRWQRVAGFRRGSEMKGGRYWEEEEGNVGCGLGEENWKHVWEECTDWGCSGTW